MSGREWSILFSLDARTVRFWETSRNSEDLVGVWLATQHLHSLIVLPAAVTDYGKGLLFDFVVDCDIHNLSSISSQ